MPKTCDCWIEECEFVLVEDCADVDKLANRLHQLNTCVDDMLAGGSPEREHWETLCLIHLLADGGGSEGVKRRLVRLNERMNGLIEEVTLREQR